MMKHLSWTLRRCILQHKNSLIAVQSSEKVRLPNLYTFQLRYLFQKQPPALDTKTIESIELLKCEIKDLDKSNPLSVVIKVMEVLHCSKDTALKLINENKNLVVIPKEELQKNYETLKKAHAKNTFMHNHAWLLCLSNRELTVKVYIVNKLKMKLKEVAPLMKLDETNLSQIVTYTLLQETKYGNRLVYLSKLLQCPVSTVCEIVIRNKYLLTMPIKKLEDIMVLVEEFNLSKEDIVRDPWIFCYNVENVRERLEAVQELDLGKLKLWMIRCPKSRYEKLRSRSEMENTLASSNFCRIEYICKKLNCKREYLDILAKKHKYLQRVRIIKLDGLLEILAKYEFTTYFDIMHLPDLLQFSNTTLRNRVAQLEEIGHRPNNILILGKPNAEFSDYINSLKSKKSLKEIQENTTNS
ncbi:transcription termination factor, mitochondrial [Orussus abietinus]|uniref:transcription termination factor, mitochondrial n=1 Tax=Orussus abietinus TaxID=222816 RepID=UPI000626CE14|nr:transcription termination factor, mitochondrial [Orussus abietinus]